MKGAPNRRNFTRLLASLAWLAASLLAAPAWAQSMQEVLGPGDTVRITVIRFPDLTSEVRIAEDGKVNVPLVGPLEVQGLTPAQAAAHMAKHLRSGQYIRDPQVDVSVIDARSRQVSVLGFVKNPGRYQLDGKTARITDLIAMAGGLMPEASDTAVVQRSRGGKTEALNVDLISIVERGDITKNLELASGDSVFIPKAPVVYVYGEVTKGGSYRLEPGMTVMQAISVAGGVTPRGSERRARIRSRGADGQWKEIAARPSDPVQPNDVIYIPESLF